MLPAGLLMGGGVLLKLTGDYDATALRLERDGTR